MQDIRQVKQAFRLEADTRFRDEYCEEALLLELKRQIEEQRSGATVSFDQMDFVSESQCLICFEERTRVSNAFWGLILGL